MRAIPWLKLAALLITWTVCQVIIHKAWLNEDAFITLRVIDNFINGYGLRWNVEERVQVYTHPLWMLANIPAHYFYGNGFLSAIGMGVLFAAATIFILCCLCRNLPVMLLVGVLYYYYRSVNEYSTSGLENSLSHLLVAMLAWVVMRRQRLRHPCFWVSLVCSLAMLNRLDMVFLVAPIALVLVVFRVIPLRAGEVALGAVPLVGWMLFATIYYGSPFPTSYYAKIGGGLHLNRADVGWPHFYMFVKFELAAVITLCLALAAAVVQFFPRLLEGERKPEVAAFVLGIAIYIAYVLHSVPDYMLGRFYTVPTIAALCAVVMFCDQRMRWENLCIWLVLGAWLFHMLCYNYVMTNPCWLARSKCVPMQNGIMDVWKITHPRDGLYRPDGSMRRFPENRWAIDGKRFRHANKARRFVLGNIGQFPYYAGPKLFVLDQFGLSDPLLARIPVHGKFFLIGHHPKPIPRGYFKSLMGDFSALDPRMQEMARMTYNITRGDLFTRQRFIDIYHLNNGWFRRELHFYYYPKRKSV